MRGLYPSRCLRLIQRGFSSKVLGSTNETNHLKSFIRDRIRASGPITVFEYMNLATRSAAGYYSQRATKVCTNFANFNYLYLEANIRRQGRFYHFPGIISSIWRTHWRVDLQRAIELRLQHKLATCRTWTRNRKVDFWCAADFTHSKGS